MIRNKKGVLLTNIGSPKEPTPQEVRRYLKKFLSDKRVVEIPRLIWWPILYGLILPFRSNSSAKLYQKIWTEQGSPLLHFSECIAKSLQTQLNIPVELGMHYGEPSIPSALEKLRAQDIEEITILPLYPQYSATTTATTFDQVAATLKKWRNIPAISMVRDYYKNSDYITALCQSIQQHSFKHLLFSFHGIPQRCVDKGDPYQDQCKATVELITQQLNLPANKWSLSFQSRLGRAKWLTPYTEEVLKDLPQRGITDIHVICPGFAVDCLETLEEIAIRGKEIFLNAGGESFQYISALNDSGKQLEIFKKIILVE